MRAAGKVRRYHAWFLTTRTEENKTHFFNTVCFVTTTRGAQGCSHIIIIYGHSSWVVKVTNPDRPRISPFYQKKKNQNKPSISRKLCSNLWQSLLRRVQSSWHSQIWTSAKGVEIFGTLLPPLPPKSSNWQGDLSEIPWYSATYSNLHFDAVALTASPICLRHTMDETTNGGSKRFFQEVWSEVKGRLHCLRGGRKSAW